MFTSLTLRYTTNSDRTSASPIGRAPDDILHEIFLCCLPIHSWRITLTPLEAPVLLSHVCHRWRQVSLASPALWKRLRWDIQRIHVTRGNLETLVCAAARAKLASRTLQLLIRTRPWIEDTEKSDPFTPIPDIAKALLIPPVAALTRLALRGVPIAQIHSLPTGSFPSLVDLVLHFEADFYRFPWDEKGPLKAFSDAFALRRLGLGASLATDYRRGRHIASNLILPMDQLTHILDFDDPEELSTLSFYLPQTHNLRYLFVELHEAGVGLESYLNWRNATVRPLTVPKLETLSINFWACGEGEIIYPVLLDAFEFPNLKALRLQGAALDFTDEQFWTLPLVDRFLAKLSHLQDLTYLSLCPSSVTPITLRGILLATPNITTLDMHVYEDISQGLTTLAWWSNSGTLLPKLKTLVLELDDSFDDDDDEREIIDPNALDAFLRLRMCGANDAPTSFRQFVVYSAYREEMDDEVPFVRVALAYVSVMGLAFERRLVEERGRKQSYLWVERDPELRDWPELAEAPS